MREKFNVKKLMVILLVTVLMTGNVVSIQAAIPSLSNSRFMKTYVLSTGNNTYVYTSSNLRTRGTSSPRRAYNAAIYASDEIYVYSMNNTYSYISYPTSSGRRYGYVRTSSITANNYSKNAVTSSGSFTTYRRAGAARYGSVAKGDTVYTIGSSGNWKQIIYPIAGNRWKMGWCSNSDYNKYLVQKSSSNAIAAGKYVITSALNNGYAVDVSGNYTSNGTNIHLWSKSANNKAQIFRIEPVGNGYYKIVHSYSGKVLDVTGGKAGSGVNVQLHDWNKSNAQLWIFISVGDGYYYIKNKLGYYLDVYSGTARNGQNIWVHSLNRSGAQKFKLNRYSGSASTSTTSISTSAANNLVNYALSQVGVGDRKGNNVVKYNTWYYGNSVAGPGRAWCAAFVSYCANQTGLLNTSIPKHCSCPAGVNWFKNQRKFYKSQYYGGTYTPKKGDIVYYTSNGSISSHVGIITGTPINGYLQVVEGNVYCSDGNYKVVKFTSNSKRRVNSSYVLGYGVWY